MIAVNAYSTETKGQFSIYLCFLLALAVYATGLGGQYIPTNGDELVYAHIARLTAASDHWLPLASELNNMRNTKPPLLFWQGMLASGWGHNWTLLALRLPSLAYTFLITTLVAASVRAITHNTQKALLGACVYLAFFCTFRYGRPYLTSAAETFWLDLPIFCFLWLKRPQSQPTNQTEGMSMGHALVNRSLFDISTIAIFLLVGISWGLGAAYKSFALIAPTAIALWCAAWWCGHGFFKVSLGTFVAACVGLGIFGLWFVIDPDPGAVWREFVIGENAGKLVDAQGYWHEAIYGGGSSLWVQLLAFVENAGLLAFVVLGLGAAGATHWRLRVRQVGSKTPIPPHLWVLLAWAAVWLLVFAVPSQRSARYVIPAMPAVAILIAVYWDNISRSWFMPCLGLIGVALVAFGRIAWAEHGLGIASGAELALVLLWTAAGVMTILLALAKPPLTRICTLLACFIFYGSLNATLAPLDGPQGQFAWPGQTRFAHKKIAVPVNFNAQFERFEFLLNAQRQGNRFVPFDMALLQDDVAKNHVADDKLKTLLAQFDAVIWASTSASQQTALDKVACLPGCKLLAQRWTVRGRHTHGEIRWDNLWYPQDWLFSREWLVTAARP